MTSRKVTLLAEKLVKKYRNKKVVDNVTIEINKGEIIGLLGPNGAGKTTIFNMVVGLIKPEGGKIFLGDIEITKMPMYKRSREGMSYLPQEPSIFRKLTVEQNLMAILEMLDFSKEIRQSRVNELLKEFGLEKLRKQMAYSLSGGEKRRCEIARALLSNSTFLLRDEPFVGIDPITVTEIQGMIADLKKKGIGILVTDHNVRETLEIIDRAYIIYEGRILFGGDAQELISNPEARRVYLGKNFQV